jgi:hypothetical protein
MVRVTTAVRRIAVLVACGMLAAAWCCRALAVGATAGAGAQGAVEASVGIGGEALRGGWPKVLQVLQLVREQGIILAVLLGLSAFSPWRRPLSRHYGLGRFVRPVSGVPFFLFPCWDGIVHELID